MPSTSHFISAIAASAALAAPAHAQTTSYDDPLLSGYGDSGAMEQTLLGPAGLDGGGGGGAPASRAPLPERVDGTIDLRQSATRGAPAPRDRDRRDGATARGSTGATTGTARSLPAAPPLATRPVAPVAAAPLPLADIAGGLLLALVGAGTVAVARRRPRTPVAA